MSSTDLAASKDHLQSQCDLGQRQLMEMDYLLAESTLVAAERAALAVKDFDTLARLYLPLQEVRRQIRQRCGEGIVCLNLISQGPDDRVTGEHVVDNFSHGQLLVAGWGTIEPAVRVRELASRHGLFLETFLAAVFPVGAARAVVIVPTEDVSLPPPMPMLTIDALLAQLPPHCIVLHADAIVQGSRRGTPQTYGEVMALWEQLHAAFLAAADMQVDPMQKIEAYRKTIRVDAACELAHQRLSNTAKAIARSTAKQ